MQRMTASLGRNFLPVWRRQGRLYQTRTSWFSGAMMAAGMKSTVLVAEPFKDHPACEALYEIFDVIWWDDFMSNPQKYLDKIQGHLSAHTTFPEEMVASMPKLKVVSTNGVGVNHLDVRMYNRYGVKVGNTPGILSDCAADQAFALILACARRLADGFDLLRKGQHSCQDAGYLGKKVTGSTLGIVGMGRIGYKVAERALGFQMKVLYHNRNRRSEDKEIQVKATYCSKLDDLLSEADFVVITTPLTEHTKGLIGAQQLNKMKHTAFIVNIGRGPIIDTQALISALQAGQIAGAGLDVTDPEPLPVDHPLLHMPNVVVTPHLGSATVETRQAMFAMCVQNIRNGIEGRPLVAEVLP